MWRSIAQGTPTAAFVKNANWQNPSDQCVADITRAVGEAGVGLFNADAVAGKLMGDTIYVNPMILGYAWQKGWIPLGLRVAAAGHRAQRRGGGEQQDRV
jgi:indolepyruvate ferredoxin oxidoreductase